MIQYLKQIGNLSEIKNKHVRTALRGIILRNDNILLIRTLKGDLKFPGGGLEANETYEEALIREIREETGYVNVSIQTGNDFASYIERKVDEFKLHTVFESRSYYLFAEIKDDERVTLKLDDYEEELQFQAEWISIKEAIIQNTYALLSDEGPNDWVERELTILKAIWAWKFSNKIEEK
jgi:8-oxo-dGTP pyrophosphatase MutT (NUDIX family)